jgi:hypothetical protein
MNEIVFLADALIDFKLLFYVKKDGTKLIVFLEISVLYDSFQDLAFVHHLFLFEHEAKRLFCLLHTEFISLIVLFYVGILLL